MDKLLKKILCITFAFVLCASFAGCSKSSDDSAAEAADTPDTSEMTMEDVMEQEASEEEDYDNGIFFEEEDDGAEIITKKAAAEDFVGSWEATSGQSKYQFGNVDINISIDKKWTGNISDEDLKGKWTETDEGLYLTSDLMNLTLSFTKDNVLIMRTVPDKDDPEDIELTAVLTKK